MSRTEMTDAELTDRVERTLRAKATRVTASAGPFDPERAVGGDELPGPRWRTPRVGVAVAAVALLALAAGAVAMLRADGGPGRTEVQASTTTTAAPDDADEDAAGDGEQPDHPAPDDAWAPGWVPGDLLLWDVRWATVPPVADVANVQLFARPQGGGVLVDIQPANPGGTTGGDPVTVRGIPGTIMPAKEFPESASTVFWHEGASLSATFTGMSLDEALAVLEVLTWRSDDHQQGFAAPADGSAVLAGETAGAGGGPVSTVELQFADEERTLVPGESRQLTVRTSAGGGGVTYQDLLTQLHGDPPSADGTTRSFDPTYGTLTVVWPDGRRWWIDANSSGVSQDELQQVADGMAPVSADDLEALRDEVDERLAALPAAAEATVPSGATLTVRTVGGSSVLCVSSDGGAERCADPTDATNGPAVAGVVVDGRWFVLAATTGAPVTVSDSGVGDPGAAPSGVDLRGPIPGETATDGDWRLFVAEVPGDIGFVFVESGGSTTMVERPAG